MKIVTELWYTKNLDSVSMIENQAISLENNLLYISLELEYL